MEIQLMSDVLQSMEVTPPLDPNDKTKTIFVLVATKLQDQPFIIARAVYNEFTNGWTWQRDGTNPTINLTLLKGWQLLPTEKSTSVAYLQITVVCKYTSKEV